MKVSGGKDFSDWLHQGVSDDDGDIGSGVAKCQLVQRRCGSPISLLGQAREVGGRETMWCGADIELEHSSSSLDFGEGDIYSLLEPPLDSWIQLPRGVRSAKYKDTDIVITHTVDLPSAPYIA